MTHPFHPWFDQEFVFIGVRQAWGEQGLLPRLRGRAALPVGPRTAAHLQDAIASLDIDLRPDEVAELEAGTSRTPSPRV